MIVTLKVWTKRGLLITDPIERGLRVVEISILTEQANQPPANQDWQVRSREVNPRAKK